MINGLQEEKLIKRTIGMRVKLFSTVILSLFSVGLFAQDQAEQLKYGNDKEFRVKSAKLLAMLILTQKGTPVLFQGEEIGMTNYEFKSLDQFDDLEVLGNLQKALDSGISKDEYLNHLNCK